MTTRAWGFVCLLAATCGCTEADSPRCEPEVELEVRDDVLGSRVARYLREELRPKLTCDLKVVSHGPFLLVGTAPMHRMRNRARYLVGTSMRLLERELFERAPSRMTEVWVLEDYESYAAHSRRLFGAPPRTPYGFFVTARRTLMINYGFGDGILTHELVHAYMQESFPTAPPWFHEGLGSLFEVTSVADGRLRGAIDWRLPLLQIALRHDAHLSLRRLTAADASEFYHSEPGLNYAQARYLLYFLQDLDLLVPFYRKFLASSPGDPTGYGTLQEVLRMSPEQMETHWERFVLDLEYPEERFMLL